MNNIEIQTFLDKAQIDIPALTGDDQEKITRETAKINSILSTAEVMMEDMLGYKALGDTSITKYYQVETTSSRIYISEQLLSLTSFKIGKKIITGAKWQEVHVIKLTHKIRAGTEIEVNGVFGIAQTKAELQDTLYAFGVSLIALAMLKREGIVASNSTGGQNLSYRGSIFSNDEKGINSIVKKYINSYPNTTKI